MSINYLDILVENYGDKEWSCGDTYDSIVFHDGTVKPSDVSLIALSDETKRLIAFKQLRGERNRILHDTDWWASNDLTMTSEQSDYRQALRDLPANTEDPASPTWPTPPE